MQPTLHARPFTAAGWRFEMKLDGFRALARRRGAEVELLSRTGRSIGAQFPEILAQLKRIPGAWAIDAELVVPDERGHPSFEHVRRRSCAGPLRSLWLDTKPRPRCACSTSC